MIGVDARAENNGARTSNLKMELMYESEKQVVMHHFAAEISTYKVTVFMEIMLF